MKINSQGLINLPVITESGQRLGVVESFNIETESQSVLEYIIKPDTLIAGLISGELIISRGQIIAITAKKIIVNDNISSTDRFKKFNKLFTKKKSVALNKE